MAETQEPPERREQPTWVSALHWGLPTAVWLFFSLASVRVEKSDPTAEQAGAIFADFFFPLFVALLLRLLYVKVIKRREAPRYWSPSILVTTAGIAVLFALAQAGERAQENSARDPGWPPALQAVPSASAAPQGLAPALEP